MEELIERWMSFAAQDFDVAKHLYDNYYPRPLEIICYHCQQAAEKAIKAVIISQGAPGGVPKSHDLLYEAALCRERADWLVGINATRLFSCLYGQTLNVGRVMTPTLAMVAARDAAIRGFTPELFYTVELDMGGFRLKSGRIKNREEASQLLRACRSAGRAGERSCDMSNRTEILYFRVTPEELDRINTKRAEVGVSSMSAYLRKMAMDG